MKTATRNGKASKKVKVPPQRATSTATTTRGTPTRRGRKKKKEDSLDDIWSIYKKTKDENGTEYEHHYDLIAALIYLVRNCNMALSPYPIDYELIKRGYHRDTHFKSPRLQQKETSEFAKHLADVFTIKKRRR